MLPSNMKSTTRKKNGFLFSIIKSGNFFEKWAGGSLAGPYL